MTCKHGLPLEFCPWCFVPSYPCLLALLALLAGCDPGCDAPGTRYRYLESCSEHQDIAVCEQNWAKLVERCREHE